MRENTEHLTLWVSVNIISSIFHEFIFVLAAEYHSTYMYHIFIIYLFLKDI